ncbi:MAG: glycosyltransferase family 4 protein [Bacteroidales bacterium]|nr:glycosyltransferase family 4 protein [Bacteroidales bacterium]
MKIITLVRSLTLGGVEKQMAALAKMLAGEGHQVELISYRPGDFYNDTLRETGVRHINFRPSSERALLTELESYFREARPDVVIAFHVGPATKACIIKKRWPFFKLIVSERNFNTSAHIWDYYRFILFRHADLVVPNSHAQGRFIYSHAPWLRPKLKTIVNWVELERFSPREVPHENGGKLEIVTTARVDKRKNLHGWIKAVARVASKRRDFHISWYGLCGQNSYSKKCLKMIESCGIQELFSILPATKDVPAVLGGADAFALVSFYEGTPNSLAEALSCGLPAIASDVSDNALYVRNGENGYLCKASDTDSIASALESLLESRSEFAQMGARSREIAIMHFSAEQFLKSWTEAIETARSI